MTTALALPTGSYQNRDLRSSSKKLVGCMSELMAQTAPADSKSAVPPITIRRAPGIDDFAAITAAVGTPVAPVLTAGVWGEGLNPTGALVGSVFTFPYPLGAAQSPTNLPAIVAVLEICTMGAPVWGATYAGLPCKIISVPITSVINVGGVDRGQLLLVVCQVSPTATFTGSNLVLTDTSGVVSYYTCQSVMMATALYVDPLAAIPFTIANNNAPFSPAPYVQTVPGIAGNANDMLASAMNLADASGEILVTSSSPTFITDENGAAGTQSPLSMARRQLTVAESDAVTWTTTTSYTLGNYQIGTGVSFNLPAVVAADSSLAVRGINKMQGVTYAVIGATLYTLADNGDDTGTLTAIATGIFGEGFVRMTNNTACLVILVPNTTICYTYSLVGGFQLLTAPGFTDYGAIDCNFCDSFIVFLALNGREFFNDDGQIVSGQGQITFNSGSVFPREFGTDLFVGMAVDHREVLLLGQLTSEGYLNAGNAVGDPFASAPGSFIQLGALPGSAYCIANQDQSVFWVANDRTVRRRNGQTPQRVSNSGIEAILEHADFTGSYALTPSVGGHALWALILPAESRTLCYDCLATEWFELDSVGFGYWRPLCYYNAFGKQLVGDSVSSQIGFLDTSVYTEFGVPMLQQFVTQSIYDNNNRITHRRLEVVITVGEAPDLGVEPLITLFVSRDSGRTWRARETKPMGFAGDREVRVFWTNLGQARNQTYMFQVSDPTPSYTVAIVAELDGGRW